MDKRLKVLHVVPLGTGGITSLVLNIAEKLDKERVKFDYLTFYDRKEFNEERAIALGGKKYVVPIDRYKNPAARSIFKFFYAIKIIRSSSADVIHINGSKPYDVLVGVSAKLAGTKKVFFHSHNSSMDKERGVIGLAMKVFRKMIPMISDCNLACSELAAQFMFPKKVLDAKNYIVIKNAIDVEKYCFSPKVRAEYRKKLDVENKLVIGHIGRFTPQKNHKFLVDIFENIHEKNSDAILIMIGTGELFGELKQYVASKKLEDFIWFYGATDEVPQLLQAFDCFLFPSLYEGLPVVGVEVQATGLPIVLTDTITREVGFTDLVHYLSLEDSVETWANVTLENAGKKYERQSYADLVKKAGFDISDTLKKLTELYNR